MPISDFGARRPNPIGNHNPMRSLCFFVTGMLAATAAEFAEFQPVRRRLLILRRNVVSTLTFLTLKHYIVAWHNLISNFLLSNCQFSLFAARLLQIGNRQLALGNAFTQSLPKLFRRLPCGRLHE